jgi:2-epi-5-epi-valiolone 7-phosphate 2-epimerase
LIHLGITQWSVDSPGVESVHHTARLGFSAIHIDAGPLGGDALLDNPGLQQAYTQAAADTGVEIGAIAASYLSEYGLTSPAGSEGAQKSWDLIKVSIEAASQMGVGCVFFPSFGAGEIHTEMDLMRTAEIIHEACVYAEGHDLHLATENTLSVYDHLKLLKAVDHSKFRVLIDTLNPVLWGHNPNELVEELWPYLSDQLHIKDGIDGKMGNAVLGTGDAGFLETAQTLVARGFEGTLISENDYIGEREGFAARDIAIISELFKQE